jgi:hypothetical protein
VDSFIETDYTIVLCKDKTLLKNLVVARMAFGSSMDIPADEYTAK